MHAVALTARQKRHFLLLVAALEVERRAICTRVHLGIAKLDDVLAVCNRLPDIVIGGKIVARLIHVRQLDRIAKLDRPRIRGFLSGEGLEQRRFTGAVGADHPNNATRRQRKAQVFDQKLVAHMFGQPVDLNHLVAKARAIRDHDLGTGELFALGLPRKFVIGVDPSLLLGLTRLLALPHPVKFALKRLLLGFVLARFLAQALGLLLKPGGIVALVGHASAAIQLKDPAGDVIKEIAVMGDDQDRALVVDQMLLQPCDGLGVKVVGRLVEQEHLGRFQQQLAQRDATAFTARQTFDNGVIGRTAQRLHRDIDL